MAEVPARDPRLTRLVLVAGLLLLLALLTWFALSRASQESDGAAPNISDRTQEPVAPSGFPSTTVGADGSALPSKAPGQTVPTEVVSPRVRPLPVRVSLREVASLGGGVTARIVRVEAIQGKGRGPGEVSGPSLRFTVEVRNDAGQAVTTLVPGVAAFYGPRQRPAIDLGAPGVRLLATRIAPGESASGRYAFRIPPDGRDRVRLDLDYSADLPTVIFVGGV